MFKSILSKVMSVTFRYLTSKEFLDLIRGRVIELAGSSKLTGSAKMKIVLGLAEKLASAYGVSYDEKLVRALVEITLLNLEK